jgi:hypothetical protein
MPAVSGSALSAASRSGSSSSRFLRDGSCTAFRSGSTIDDRDDYRLAGRQGSIKVPSRLTSIVRCRRLRDAVEYARFTHRERKSAGLAAGRTSNRLVPHATQPGG